MFKVDLHSQVPDYRKDQANWGGPACSQMAMHGYPDLLRKNNLVFGSLWYHYHFK